MPRLTDETRDRIGAAIAAKNPSLRCPFCAAQNVMLADGYAIDVLQGDPAKHELGGESITSAILACTNCGYLMQFSLPILGLMPDPS